MAEKECLGRKPVKMKVFQRATSSARKRVGPEYHHLTKEDNEDKKVTKTKGMCLFECLGGVEALTQVNKG